MLSLSAPYLACKVRSCGMLEGVNISKPSIKRRSGNGAVICAERLAGIYLP